MRRVLITGASGLIGQILRRHLQGEYELRFLTHRRAAFASHVGNIADLDSIRAAFVDADAVVHLAANAAVSASWPEVLEANIVGTRNVFEAARETGVTRVVFASSNHVVGMYEVEAARDPHQQVPPMLDELSPLRPDSLYGVSKAFGEAIARMYSDRFDMRVICLRIGTVLGHDDPTRVDPTSPADGFAIPLLTRERLRATWLSHRDCAQLVRCALEADVRWSVVYGISNNADRYWDLDGARTSLGYEPQDSSPS